MGKGNYKDVKLVRKAYEEILEVVKPGDVINQVNHARWYEFWLKIGFWGIRTYQKNLFGKDANWYDTHTMLFFDEWATFSVEPPKACILPLFDYCLSELSIYRLKLTEMTSDNIETMMEAADRMMGSAYDIGQLLDIALRAILGYPQHRPLSFFDWGKKKKVCSVGIRVCFEYLYNQKIKPTLSNPPEGKWLFHSLNPEKWSKQKVEDYNGTDVEATSPAHFANYDHFQNEFELIARFKEGKRIV